MYDPVLPRNVVFFSEFYLFYITNNILFYFKKNYQNEIKECLVYNNENNSCL